jgi:dolichol-phosphate mannosyltransferase
VVMPARNEEGAVAETLSALVRTLRVAVIPFEIVLVDDGSTDETALRVRACSAGNPEVRLVQHSGRHGFGMADGSDSPEDVVTCYRRLLEGPDCVFGSRFMRGAKVTDYPRHKLVLNSLANWFIKVLFGVRFNDFTNAFKLYRWAVIEGMQPLISPHFNLTVEMPLKAMVRGYSFAVIPIRWTNQKTGISKLKIKAMGSRYLFIVLYLWLEKYLARADYHRRYNAEQWQEELTGHHV